jgi:hypothetical protein
MLRIPFLRNVFLAMLATVLAVPLYLYLAAIPTFNSLLIAHTEEEAQRVSSHLAALTLRELGRIDAEAVARTPGFEADLRPLIQEFGLYKLRVFDAGGLLIYSSAPGEIGRVNRDAYFTDIVAKGKTWSKLEHKGGVSADGEALQRSIVEAYVPIMRDGRFLGAFEIYYDITERSRQQNAVLHQTNLVMLLVAAGLLVFLVVVLNRTARTFAERQRDAETIENLGYERTRLL